MVVRLELTTDGTQGPAELSELLNVWMSGPVVSMDDEDCPPWLQEGVVTEINEQLFVSDTRLECLSDGCCVAVGKRGQPIQLIWNSDGSYFAWQLSEEETKLFLQLAGAKTLA